MSQNKFTTNNNPTLAAVSNSDGETPVYLYADPATHGLVISGASGGGGASTIADGADVAEGATTDGAVTAGSAGTVSGKLRQISADISTSNGLMATSANQTNGTQQTKITDGTQVAAVISNDTGYNGIPANATTKVIPFTTSTPGAQILLADTDVRGYTTIGAVYTSVGSGLALTAQFAPNSGGTYITSAATWANRGTTTGSPTGIGAAVNTIYESPILGPYFRLNVSALSGTFSGYIVLSTRPLNYQYLAVLGRFTNNNAAPTGTNVGVLPGVATTAVQAWTEGNQVLESMDLSGNQRVKGTSESATAAAIPTNATYIGANSSGNVGGLTTAANQADGVNLTGGLTVGPWAYNGTNWDRVRSIINATNSTGTGILAAGILAQFDDVSPTAITENQFGNLRMSANRNLYGTIRDAAGNERGANVTANSELNVIDPATSATAATVPGKAVYLGIKNSSGNLQGINAASAINDGDAGGGTATVESYNFNGTNWDRPRNNTTGVVIAAGATASNAGVTITTYNAAKAVIIINISAFTSGSLTVVVNGITSSGYSYPILSSTALAATGVTPLRIFPGSTPSANAVANDVVPRSLQVVTTVSGTLSYGIDYGLSV